MSHCVDYLHLLSDLVVHRQDLASIRAFTDVSEILVALMSEAFGSAGEGEKSGAAADDAPDAGYEDQQQPSKRSRRKRRDTWKADKRRRRRDNKLQRDMQNAIIRQSSSSSCSHP